MCFVTERHGPLGSTPASYPGDLRFKTVSLKVGFGTLRVFPEVHLFCLWKCHVNGIANEFSLIWFLVKNYKVMK